jgi:hypothetical protein
MLNIFYPLLTVGLHNLFCPIGRTIIHHKDLKIAEGLSKDAIYGSIQYISAIVGRDNYGNTRHNLGIIMISRNKSLSDLQSTQDPYKRQRRKPALKVAERDYHI